MFLEFVSPKNLQSSEKEYDLDLLYMLSVMSYFCCDLVVCKYILTEFCWRRKCMGINTEYP